MASYIINSSSPSRLGRLGRNHTLSRSAQGRWAVVTRFLWRYLPDWILAIFFASLSNLLGKTSGFKREFSLNDTSIQHTYAINERVPRWALHLISSLIPAIIMPVINLIYVRSLWDLHNSWLGLMLSLSLTGSISNLMKVSVGRPRPDLISRCLPSPGLKDSPVWGLSNYTICTQVDEYILRDGFRSFPSGHASLSFAGLGFLSFYLVGKFRLWDERGYTAKVWLALTPLMGAALVAITRTMDYRHHWQDVLIGSLLGLSLAFFCYRQFFPSLSHPTSQFPLAPRVDLSVVFTSEHFKGTQHEREPLVRSDDEEEGL